MFVLDAHPYVEPMWLECRQTRSITMASMTYTGGNIYSGSEQVGAVQRRGMEVPATDWLVSLRILLGVTPLPTSL